MRFLRYQLESEPARYGWILDDRVGPVEGDIFGQFQREEAFIPVDQVRLLPPVQASKVICVGRNYVAHAKEHDAEVPEVPLIFLKPPSAMIGHQAEIVLPPH